MLFEAVFTLLLMLGGARARHLGKELGALSRLHHGVRGDVYAVDSRTLYLHDFHYDGEGPAAYFYVGASKIPGGAGAGAGALRLRLRDERGGAGPLRRYRGEGLTLSLPDGKTLRDVAWFSVWCDEYSVNFGSVNIPSEFEYPKPAKLSALRGVHGVRSDPVVVVDAQTLLIPNFSYDGEAPDAKFWVGRGETPSPQGIRIPDENGKETPLRKYDRKTIVLTLPGELTVFDIGHFAVWCEAFTVNFGHIALPRQQLANVPPSLKMLGVSPQSKLNCEVLHDELAFEARWAVAGDSIVLQLVAKLEDGEYMSFGISGHPQRSQMVGGDVAVAWVDKRTLKGYAEDYYLDAKSQCAGVHGSCPDERLAPNTNSVRLLNAALVNGYSIVTYQRPLRAADKLDLPVFTNGSQPIIWAVGPLNSENEVSYHQYYTKGDKFIEFGRPPMWNCPMPEGDEEQRHEHSTPPDAPPQRDPQRDHQRHSQADHQTAVIKPKPVPTPRPVAKVTPWEIPGIQCYEPPDGVFYAQMGPTGGTQGYSAITGHVGWGISWYINGLLIPEITVVRGTKYTFVVEGGSDPEVPARYHPFYITNDPVGGYYHKNDDEKKGIEIYAGVRRARGGDLVPTGVGRLCNWTPDSAGPGADEYPSFGAYQRSLTLVCEEGSPGVVTWTPDRNTPNTVYYQCFTHRHLGWKINVVDECDAADAEESRVIQSVALPDLLSEASVQVPARVTLDNSFLDERKKLEKIINMNKNYNDFSSTKEVFTRDEFPLRNHLYSSGTEYELPVSNLQIKEVIEAVENLEDKMKGQIKSNSTHLPQKQINQYQVYEDVKEFTPEQPIREGEEYVVQVGQVPDGYLLPPNQKPVTLQSVLRPNMPRKPVGAARPHFRRPSPPEIILHRPSPYTNIKGNNVGYPLAMPHPHSSNGMKKPFNKFPNTRFPPTMGRPIQNIPPMKSMPPLYHSKQNHQPQSPTIFNQGNPKPLNGPVQAIITSKLGHNIPSPVQSQTLSLSKSDIIANQVVKSQITLPGTNDAVAQPSNSQIYATKPQAHGQGQIIFGKPVENPVPLDQQMMQTKPQPIKTKYTPDVPQSSTPLTSVYDAHDQPPPQNEIKTSDFIGQSAEISTLTPAVNTGFKPDSIVIESGFKPIIREPLMASEDRITNVEAENANRREDTDVLDDYEDSPQYISNHAFPVQIPSDKMTETFEPMFIPSPPDHLLPTNDTTKEIFPKNHAKEDRPHPVYVKSESELNALFGKKNIDKDLSSDLVMESDRVSPQYLPPEPKLPKEHSEKLSAEQTFTTYDGKTISAATLTSLPDINKVNTKLFSSKLSANAELLLKMPQFGPFKGEIPPPVAEHITKEGSSSRLAETHLKLVSSLVPKESDVKEDTFIAEGSEKLEKSEKDDNRDKSESYEDEEYDSEEQNDDIAEADEKRSKRDAKMIHYETGKEASAFPNSNDSQASAGLGGNSVEFAAAGAAAGAARRAAPAAWASVLVMLLLRLQLA